MSLPMRSTAKGVLGLSKVRYTFEHPGDTGTYSEESYSQNFTCKECDNQILWAGLKETATLEPTNPYSAAKAGAEMMAKAYLTSYKLPVITTRGNNVSKCWTSSTLHGITEASAHVPKRIKQTCQ